MADEGRVIVFTDFLIKRQMEGEHLLNDRSALVDSLVVSIISKRVTLTNFVRTHGGISLFDHHSFFSRETAHRIENWRAPPLAKIRQSN